MSPYDDHQAYGEAYPDDATARVPPHNLHAEASVLGSLMKDNATRDSISGVVAA